MELIGNENGGLHYIGDSNGEPVYLDDDAYLDYLSCAPSLFED